MIGDDHRVGSHIHSLPRVVADMNALDDDRTGPRFANPPEILPTDHRLLERGTDIRIIQALLGHDKLETTARYTRVATGMIAGVESPLDLLSQPRKKPKKSRRYPPPA